MPETSPSSKPRLKALPFLFAVLGLVVGYAAAKLILPDLSGAGPWWVLVPGALLVIFLVIALHETGHVVAGLLMGFPFLFWTVGPLSIMRTTGGLRFRYNRARITWGGMAACMPVGGDDLPRRMVFYALGGPLTSLVAAGALLAIAALAGESRGTEVFLAAIGGLVSLFIAAATLVPHRSGGHQSDGALARMYAHGGRMADMVIRRTRIMASSISGTRPRDLPREDLLSLVEQSASVPEHAADLYLLYGHYLDGGDLERAAEAIDRAARQAGDVSPILRSAIAAEQAFFLFFIRGDRAAAEEWSQRVRRDHLTYSPDLAFRWQAVRALAAGNRAEAAKRARSGLRAARASFDRGGAQFSADLLERIIRAASQGPAPG